MSRPEHQSFADDASDRSVDELDRAIGRLVQPLNAESHRMLVLVREFARESQEDLLLAYALQATAAQVEERCRQLRNSEPESVHAAQARGVRARPPLHVPGL